MGKFHLHKDGVIMRSGTCPDGTEHLQAVEGMTLHIGECDLPYPPKREPTYADKRRSEYPPVEEYLDAVVKGDQKQVNAYLQKCLDVKAKYPK